MINTTCLHCNLPTKRKQKYCSNLCQQRFQETLLLKHWLETGQCKPRSSGYVKRYLLKKFKSKCSICSMGTTWNGSDLNLIIDHVNGNPEDNNVNNLRLVCPNCDSQLPTFKSRNRGLGRKYRRERYSQGKSY